MRPAAALLACALALATAPQTSAQVTDTWRGKDKRDHATVSAGLGGLAALVIREPHPLLNDWGCGLTCQRWAACLAPGIGKEAYDSRRGGPGNWSWKDMAANGVGCGIGLAVGGWVISPRGIGYSKALP